MSGKFKKLRKNLLRELYLQRKAATDLRE